MDKSALIKDLFKIGAVKFGQFKLKTGIISPIYFDFRTLVSHPKILKSISCAMWEKVKEENLNNNFNLVCGVPYTALFMATVISVENGIPLIFKRKEVKDYGTGKLIEGNFSLGENCLIIEDVVTTGSSIIETVECLRKESLKINTAIIILERGEVARDNLNAKGIQLIALFTIQDFLNELLNASLISQIDLEVANIFLDKTKADFINHKKISTIFNNELIPGYSCPTSQNLLSLMLKKKSNLCLSADLKNPKEIIELIEQLGSKLVLVKTHLDLIEFENFREINRFKNKLKEFAEKFEFLIMEDRKFADIGATVFKQLSCKPFEIGKWADLVTVHGIPGPGILKAISEFSEDLSVVLIYEMSSSGNLTVKLPSYKNEINNMVNGFESKISGFVTQSKVDQTQTNKFLHFMPGVSLEAGSDSLGQQYTTVEDVILKRFADIIIVGRGIIGKGKENWIETAEEFRDRGWRALSSRILQQRQEETETSKL